MDATTYFALYFFCAYLMLLRYVSVQVGFWDSLWGSLLWPLVLILMLMILLWELVFPGWHMDIVDRNDNRSPFGTRQPDSKPGIAIRFPGFEIQFWKNIK